MLSAFLCLEVPDLKYEKATIKDIDIIYNLVQETIKTIYPKYYPIEIVDFFCNLHCKDNIEKDINDEHVGILSDNGIIVGTGSYVENHITRVYVKPEYQGQGYGNYIMQNLEEQVLKNYDTVCLDSSLPASKIYENRGYETIKHEKWECANSVILVYEVMEKRF